jgi:hypothetical protein
MVRYCCSDQDACRLQVEAKANDKEKVVSRKLSLFLLSNDIFYLSSSFSSTTVFIREVATSKKHPLHYQSKLLNLFSAFPAL